MAGSGPISRALESNITSHLPGCGVRRLLIHQVKSSSRAQFSTIQGILQGVGFPAYYVKSKIPTIQWIHRSFRIVFAYFKPKKLIQQSTFCNLSSNDLDDRDNLEGKLRPSLRPCLAKLAGKRSCISGCHLIHLTAGYGKAGHR